MGQRQPVESKRRAHTLRKNKFPKYKFLVGSYLLIASDLVFQAALKFGSFSF